MPEDRAAPVYEAFTTVTPSPKIVCAMATAVAVVSIGSSAGVTTLHAPELVRGSAKRSQTAKRRRHFLDKMLSARLRAFCGPAEFYPASGYCCHIANRIQMKR